MSKYEYIAVESSINHYGWVPGNTFGEVEIAIRQSGRKFVAEVEGWTGCCRAQSDSERRAYANYNYEAKATGETAMEAVQKATARAERSWKFGWKEHIDLAAGKIEAKLAEVN